MANGKKIDPKRISEIAEGVGGWERLLSSDYEITEDVFAQLEGAGIRKKYLQDYKRTLALPARERIIKEIAQAVYVQSELASNYRSFKGMEFWANLDREQRLQVLQPDARMHELGISVDDIRQEILTRFPNAFEPSTPITRGKIRLTKKATE